MQGVAAAVAGAVVLAARYGTEGLRSRFEDVAAPAFGFVGGAYSWARERVTGAPLPGPACLRRQHNRQAAARGPPGRPCLHALCLLCAGDQPGLLAPQARASQG